MNIEQLIRNDLSIPGNVKYFTKEILNYDFRFEPASLTNLLTEAFLSDNESFSVQAWFATLVFLSKYNAEDETLLFKGEIFSENKKIKAYTRMIKKIFELFFNEKVVLSYYLNFNKWTKKILNELPPKWKANIYAIDAYFSKELRDFGYKSMSNILTEEGFKVKTMTSAYYSFIDDDLD